MSTISRGVVVWVCIIIVEVLHGVTRTMFLAPAVGDFRARQIAVFTGSFLVVLVATSFIGWLRPASYPAVAVCDGCESAGESPSGSGHWGGRWSCEERSLLHRFLPSSC